MCKTLRIYMCIYIHIFIYIYIYIFIYTYIYIYIYILSNCSFSRSFSTNSFLVKYILQEEREKSRINTKEYKKVKYFNILFQVYIVYL